MVPIAIKPALEMEMKITDHRSAVKMLPVKYLERPRDMSTTRTWMHDTSTANKEFAQNNIGCSFVKLTMYDETKK